MSPDSSREWGVHQKLKKLGFKKLQPVNGDSANINKLLLDRVDLIVSSPLPLVPLQKEVGFTWAQLERTPVKVLNKVEFYMAFGQSTSKELVNSVRDALEQVHSQRQTAKRPDLNDQSKE